MNRNTQRLGYLTSWGLIILMILYIVLLLLPIFVHHDRVWTPSKESYYSIDTSHDLRSDLCGFVLFLQTPLILVLFACFHDYAESSLKIFSGIALSFIISFTVLRTWSYLAQFEIDRINFHSFGNDSALYFTHKMLTNFTSSGNLLAITVFMALAELFLAPVFYKKNKIEIDLKHILLISGIMNLISVLPIISGMEEISAYCYLFSLIFFSVVLVLCIKFFKQVKSQKI